MLSDRFYRTYDIIIDAICLFWRNLSDHSATEEFLFKTPLNLFFNAPSALMCFSAWTVQNKWHVLCRGLLSGGNSNDCNCYRGFMDCSK